MYEPFAESSVEDKPVYCMLNVRKTVWRRNLSTKCFVLNLQQSYAMVSHLMEVRAPLSCPRPRPPPWRIHRSGDQVVAVDDDAAAATATNVRRVEAVPRVGVVVLQVEGLEAVAECRTLSYCLEHFFYSGPVLERDHETFRRPPVSDTSDKEPVCHGVKQR